jgi:hypothetical protein
VGTCLALGLGFLTLSFLADARNANLVPALVFGLLTIPAAAIFTCESGWPRWAMLAITLGLAASGLTASALATLVQPANGSPLAHLGETAFGVFLLGAFVSQWLANWLATQRPQR